MKNWLQPTLKQGNLNKHNINVFVTQNHHDNLARSSLFISSGVSGRCCRVFILDDVRWKLPSLVASGKPEWPGNPSALLRIARQLKILERYLQLQLQLQFCFTSGYPKGTVAFSAEATTVATNPAVALEVSAAAFKASSDTPSKTHMEHSCVCWLPEAGDIFFFCVCFLVEEPVTEGADWGLATEQI